MKQVERQAAFAALFDQGKVWLDYHGERYGLRYLPQSNSFVTDDTTSGHSTLTWHQMGYVSDDADRWYVKEGT